MHAYIGLRPYAILQATPKQPQQTQRGEATEQVQRYHLGPQLQRDSPHAEQSLRNHQREQKQRKLEGLPALLAVLPCKRIDKNDHEPKRAGEVTMNDFGPRFRVLKWRIGKCSFRRRDLLGGSRPQCMAIAGW